MTATAANDASQSAEKSLITAIWEQKRENMQGFMFIKSYCKLTARGQYQTRFYVKPQYAVYFIKKICYISRREMLFLESGLNQIDRSSLFQKNN